MAPQQITEDYYVILELQDTHASKDAVKASYRRLALLRHPDKNPGNPNATKRFQKLNTAYSVLKDDALRRDYDKCHLPLIRAAMQQAYFDQGKAMKKPDGGSKKKNKKNKKPKAPKWATQGHGPAAGKTPLDKKINEAEQALHVNKEKLTRTIKDRDEQLRALDKILKDLDRANKKASSKDKTSNMPSKKAKKTRHRNHQDHDVGGLTDDLESLGVSSSDWDKTAETVPQQLVQEGISIYESLALLQKDFCKASLRLGDMAKRVKDAYAAVAPAKKQDQVRAEKTMANIKAAQDWVRVETRKHLQTTAALHEQLMTFWEDHTGGVV